MMEDGLLNEVKNVMEICGNNFSRTALQAIGYKEFIDYFNGNCDLETAVEKVKQGSRNYAKRQLTWFRKPSWVNWISLQELLELEML